MTRWSAEEINAAALAAKEDASRVPELLGACAGLCLERAAVAWGVYGWMPLTPQEGEFFLRPWLVEMLEGWDGRVPFFAWVYAGVGCEFVGLCRRAADEIFGMINKG